MASPPLWITPVPGADVARGDGELVTEFVQGYCRVTKESWGGRANTLLQMRQWQNNTIGCVYAKRPDGRLRHRQALIGLPRKNGKSALGSSMGLYGLVTGEEGSEIYSCAADKEQARIVFNVAKRMVELDPGLDIRQNGCIRIFRDQLINEKKNSIYKVISSEAFTKEGLNPTVVIYDELHAAPNDELYNVMTLAQGARRNPMMIAITTAGVKTDSTGQDSICYRQFQHGVQICKGQEEDDSFFMVWWGAPDGADHKDPQVWEAANPGYNDLIDPEDFTSTLKRVHENDFRALDVATPLLTANRGWITMGTVETGDIVFSGDGEQTEVVGTSNIFGGRRCYEVELDDGRKIVADAQHEWHVLERNKSNKLERLTVTTEDLMPIASRKRYIEPCKGLDLPEVSLPIDPYILGYWLGDGCKTHPVISAHADDVPNLLEQVGRAGYHANVAKANTCSKVYISSNPIIRGGRRRTKLTEDILQEASRLRADGWTIKSLAQKFSLSFGTMQRALAGETGPRTSTLRSLLIDLGVQKNKHIPEKYLLASNEQRLALLQGLMDSDGTVTGEGSVRFCNTNKDLIDGVAFLARSFGWIARVHEVKTSYSRTWLVTWAITGYRSPFRLPRKASRVKAASGNYIRTVASKVVRVAEIASRPTRCLAVNDPSHSFLAGTTILRSSNTKKLNMWVSSQQAWLPQGAWNECRSEREFTPGKRGVVLGFDGSKNQDTTCLVAVTCDLEPQVIVLGLWARPFDADQDWQVPRGEVMDAIRRACHDYHVREVACDEYIWTSELNELEAEGIPIVVFPQTLTRMAPATQKMYEKVANRKISHDGNRDLAKHLDNAHLKSDSRGSRLMKDSKNSRRKIDLAMAAVMAVDRADYWANEPLEGSINGMPVADVQFVWGDGPAGGRVAPGEECALCENKVIKYPDGSPRLVRIGLQVVCNPPCGGTKNMPAEPEAPAAPPTIIW